MSFTDIDATKPAGTEKISTADNYIRELKVDIETNLAEISGYPNNSALKKAIWTTAERPTVNLVAGLFGYNTTLSADEHYDGSSWITQIAVPIGGIILWSGSIANIPSGWALCNGSNGTPDLRDRFIVGAGSSYAIGATGGAVTHLHSTGSVTLSIDQMPSHQHATCFAESDSSKYPWGVFGSGAYGTGSNCDWDNVYPYSSPTGGSQPHNHGYTSTVDNRPPYYALAYIMRIS